MAHLTESKILEIDTAAKDVLHSVYGDAESISPPVDLNQILSKFSLTLKEGEFPDRNVAGIFDRGANTIYVAKDDIPARKAFTVSHELGHFFLHKDKKSEVFYRTEMTQLDKEEVVDEAEANWFAASLLMPEKLIKKYWELTKDIEKIAAIFGTSPSATYYRLKNLQLIE